MPKTSSRFLIRNCAIGAVLAAALAGCDTGGSEPAQGDEEVSVETGGEVLTGTRDETFADADMPAAVLTDPDGKTLDLADTRGTPVLLNLWATWCAPCVIEMPLLDDLAGEFGDELQVITVSEDLDGGEKVRAFFEEKQFENLPQWIDPNNDLAVAFGGGAVLPLTVLYDANGVEIWRVIGAYDWASEDAIASLRESLDEAAATAEDDSAA